MSVPSVIEEKSRALYHPEKAPDQCSNNYDDFNEDSNALKLGFNSWTSGTKKTLLQWVVDCLPKGLPFEVRDFGVSWRDGFAFVALIDAIKTNLFNFNDIRTMSNKARLATAFDVAEAKLGIAKLLDAEDVDVEKPDEKCVMTYIAQFLQKYPNPKNTEKRLSISTQGKQSDLLEWLHNEVSQLEDYVLNSSFPIDYPSYRLSKDRIDLKRVELRNFDDYSKQYLFDKNMCKEIKHLWNILDSYVDMWQWTIDLNFNNSIKHICEWVVKAEKLISNQQMPSKMNEESAAIFSYRLEEHKDILKDLPENITKFDQLCENISANETDSIYIHDLRERMISIGPKIVAKRAKLKFLEHKCCLIAFLELVTNKLANWEVKFASKEATKLVLEQYKNFVSKNKIFQEFNKAMVDIQPVIEEYKQHGDLSEQEENDVNCFITSIHTNWQSLSKKLIFFQATLEEIIISWERFSSLEHEVYKYMELVEKNFGKCRNRQDDFSIDIDFWQIKYERLCYVAQFLFGFCNDCATQAIQDTIGKLHANWIALISEIHKHNGSNKLSISHKDFSCGIKRLSKWIESAQSVLHETFITTESFKNYFEKIQLISSEVDNMETLFKNLSKMFQNMIGHMYRDEVESIMKDLNAKKNGLVEVRSKISVKIPLLDHRLAQYESLEMGEKGIIDWLNKAEHLMANYSVLGTKDEITQRIHEHSIFFSEIQYCKATLETMNKIVENILRDDDSDKNIAIQMKMLEVRLHLTITQSIEWENKLNEAVCFWKRYHEYENIVVVWLSKTSTLLFENYFNLEQVDADESAFLKSINEDNLLNLAHATQDILPFLADNDQNKITLHVDCLQLKWRALLWEVPLYFMKRRFYVIESILNNFFLKADEEILKEEQALGGIESITSILQGHMQMFVSELSLEKTEENLRKMRSILSSYSDVLPDDSSLQLAFEKVESKKDSLFHRIMEVRKALTKMQAKFSAYQQKFKNLQNWMSLASISFEAILKEVETLDEFEKERIKFQIICDDANYKREDMKDLVKTLDSLIPYITQHEAKVERKKLDELINQYKHIIPTIEVAMIKTELFAKCYTYKHEAHQIIHLLQTVKNQIKNTSKLASLENVDTIILEHQKVIFQLDNQRPQIMSMLQRGKELCKETHAPNFINALIKRLASKWDETYDQTQQCFLKLKTNLATWNMFVSEKMHILQMIGQSESAFDLGKLEEFDLNKAREVNVALKTTLEKSCPKMSFLYESLKESLSERCDSAIRNELYDIKNLLLTKVGIANTKLIYFEDAFLKWQSYQLKFVELEGWVHNANPGMLESLQADVHTPEEILENIRCYHLILVEKMRQSYELSSDLHKNTKQANVWANVLLNKMHLLQNTLNFLNKNILKIADSEEKKFCKWKKCHRDFKRLKELFSKYETDAENLLSWPQSIPQAVVAQNNSIYVEENLKSLLICVDNILEIVSEIDKTQILSNDINVFRSKLSSAYAKSIEMKQKLCNLVCKWQDFNAEIHKIETWIRNSTRFTENILLTKAKFSTLELNKLKSIHKEISAHQGRLIMLTQNSGQLPQSISFDGALTFDMLTKLHENFISLSQNVGLKIEAVSRRNSDWRKIRTKIENIDAWIHTAQIILKKLCRTQSDCIEDTLKTLHLLQKECLDMRDNWNEVCVDFKQMSEEMAPTENPILSVFDNMKKRFEDLEKNIEQSNISLKMFNDIISWLHQSKTILDKSRTQLENLRSLHEFSLLFNRRDICDIIKNTAYRKKQIIELVENPMFKNLKTSQDAMLMFCELEADIKTISGLFQTIQHEKDDISTKSLVFNQDFHSLSQLFSEKQEALQKLLRTYVSGVNMKDILSNLITIRDEGQSISSLMGQIRANGHDLMKKDFENSLLILDKLQTIEDSWNTFQHEVNGYVIEYSLLHDKLQRFNAKMSNMVVILKSFECKCNSLSLKHNKKVNLCANVNRGKTLLNELRASKIHLENLDNNLEEINKHSRILNSVEQKSINIDLETLKLHWQQVLDKVLKMANACEIETAIWNRIQSGKSKLMSWLLIINQEICDAVDNIIDMESCSKLLSKYNAEYSVHCILKQNIEESMEDLFKYNEMTKSCLETVTHQINTSFEEVISNSKRLDLVIGSFKDYEIDLRNRIRNATATLDYVEESVKKYQNLTAGNILLKDSMQTYRDLKNGLYSIKIELDTMLEELNIKSNHIKFSNSTLSKCLVHKELNNLYKRFEEISSHSNELKTSLLHFFKNNIFDSIGSLKLLIKEIKEKILWYTPEKTSNKYNLDVKLSSLQGLQHELLNCVSLQVKTNESVMNLKDVGSSDDLSEILIEIDNIDRNINALFESFQSVKSCLKHNISLWSEFIELNETNNTRLKSVEQNLSLESGSLIKLHMVSKKHVIFKDMQGDLLKLKTYIDQQEKISKSLKEKNSESRIELNNEKNTERWNCLLTTIYSKIKCINIANYHYEKYLEGKVVCKSWLESAKMDLLELANIGSPGSSLAATQQLEKLRMFMKTFDHGQSLVNNCDTIIGILFTVIPAEDRNIIRNEVQAFQEILYQLLDEASLIHLQAESIYNQKTSIEVSISKITEFIDCCKADMSTALPLNSTLTSKKQGLLFYKTYFQEIQPKIVALKTIKDRATAFENFELALKAQHIQGEAQYAYDFIHEKVRLLEEHIHSHENYIKTLDKAKDYVNAIKPISSLLLESNFERKDVEEKLEAIKRIKKERAMVLILFENCEKELLVILQQSDINEHMTLSKDYEDCKQDFNDICSLWEDIEAKFTELLDIINDLENTAQNTEIWLKDSEKIVKDQSFNNTALMKEHQFKRLEDLYGFIEIRASEVIYLLQRGNKIAYDTSLCLKLSRINTQIQTLKNECKRKLDVYEFCFKYHKAFDEKVETITTQLMQNITMVSQMIICKADLSTLQEWQKEIHILLKERILESSTIENIIDCGKKLYHNTSPDGRENIRQQVMGLRNLWTKYIDGLNAREQDLDSCLIQFGGLTVALDQLSKWLRDQELKLLDNTPFQATFHVKTGLIQNHTILQPEILELSLVVTDFGGKSKTISVKIGEMEVNKHVESANKLYKRISEKLCILLSDLENCIEHHYNLNKKIAEVKLWLLKQKNEVSEFNNTHGELVEVQNKKHVSSQILERLTKLLKLMTNVKKLFIIVENSTSKADSGNIAQEINEIEFSISTLIQNTENLQEQQNIVICQWIHFEKDLLNIETWLLSTEKSLVHRQLRSSITEKREDFEACQKMFQAILGKQSHIERFTRNANILANASLVERIKTLVNHCNHQYTHIEFTCKRLLVGLESIWDSHRHLEQKREEFIDWLHYFSKNIRDLTLLEKHHTREDITDLIKQSVQGQAFISAISAMTKNVLHETFATGREALQSGEKKLIDNWKHEMDILEVLEKQTREYEANLISYKDLMYQNLSWLKTVEDIFDNSLSTKSISLQELQSKLKKVNTIHNEFSSYKNNLSLIEAKAHIALLGTPKADAVRMKEELSSMNFYFEKTYKACIDLMEKFKAAIENQKRLSELQKAQRESQNALWNRLASHSSPLGSKSSVKSNVTEIIDIDLSCESIEKQLRDIKRCIEENRGIISNETNESMTQELVSWHADFQKFKLTLVEVKRVLFNKLSQWEELESTIIKLTTWMNALQCKLKSYCYSTYLDEKYAQQTKYKNLNNGKGQWRLVALDTKEAQACLIYILQAVVAGSN